MCRIVTRGFLRSIAGSKEGKMWILFLAIVFAALHGGECVKTLSSYLPS